MQASPNSRLSTEESVEGMEWKTCGYDEVNQKPPAVLHASGRGMLGRRKLQPQRRNYGLNPAEKREAGDEDPTGLNGTKRPGHRQLRKSRSQWQTKALW